MLPMLQTLQHSSTGQQHTPAEVLPVGIPREWAFTGG